MIINLEFVNWVNTNCNAEVFNGNYGSFCDIDGVAIWMRQHGGQYNLADTDLAKELYNTFAK